MVPESLKIDPLYKPARPVLSRYPKDFIPFYQETYWSVSIAVLFKIDRTYKQMACSSVDEGHTYKHAILVN